MPHDDRTKNLDSGQTQSQAPCMTVKEDEMTVETAVTEKTGLLDAAFPKLVVTRRCRETQTGTSVFPCHWPAGRARRTFTIKSS